MSEEHQYTKEAIARVIQKDSNLTWEDVEAAAAKISDLTKTEVIPLLREVIVTDKAQPNTPVKERLRKFQLSQDSFDTEFTPWFRIWMHPEDYGRVKGTFSTAPLEYPIPAMTVPIIFDNTREVPEIPKEIKNVN